MIGYDIDSILLLPSIMYLSYGRYHWPVCSNYTVVIEQEGTVKERKKFWEKKNEFSNEWSEVGGVWIEKFFLVLCVFHFLNFVLSSVSSLSLEQASVCVFSSSKKKRRKSSIKIIWIQNLISCVCSIGLNNIVII